MLCSKNNKSYFTYCRYSDLFYFFKLERYEPVCMACAFSSITSVPYFPSGTLTETSGELATCYISIIYHRSHDNVGKQVSAMLYWKTLDDSCYGCFAEDYRQSEAKLYRLVDLELYTKIKQRCF